MQLNEAHSSSEEKLTHLEHAEDHVINAGADGFTHAKNTLNAVHSALKGEGSPASITTKYDGSPSIIFGHHPETGKFFVASKSAFNKKPKINYTPEDIEANHGHAPGLVSKLKAALQHLPKVTPNTGVFQGDVMHTGVKSKSNPEGDVTVKDGKASFTPNTITYTAPESETNAIKKSKFGVAIHTSYHGPSFEHMKAHFNTDTSELGSHSDVHVLQTHHETDKATYTPAQQSAYESYMDQAEAAHKKLKAGGYKALGDAHTEHLKTYINKTVRMGTQPSVEGYQTHLSELGQSKADKVKSTTAKEKHLGEFKQLSGHAEKNNQHLQNLLDLHLSLQNAKNQLAHALSSHSHYEHRVGDKQTKPEGHVISLNNRPTKIVDRAEFSRLNFQKNAK